MTACFALILFIEDIDPMTLLDLESNSAVKVLVTVNLADCILNA